MRKEFLGLDVSPACIHTGDTDILNIGGVGIGAANAHGLAYPNASLVIDLAGVVPPGKASALFSLREPTENTALESFVANRQARHNVLSIVWQDGNMPPPGLRRPSEWRDLFQALKHERRVVVCCYGGHGRTGTFLAAVLLLTRQAKSAEEAIATVRQRHCQRAVETQAQVAYLADLAKLA